jgi:hypothetical protein
MIRAITPMTTSRVRPPGSGTSRKPQSAVEHCGGGPAEPIRRPRKRSGSSAATSQKLGCGTRRSPPRGSATQGGDRLDNFGQPSARRSREYQPARRKYAPSTSPRGPPNLRAIVLVIPPFLLAGQSATQPPHGAADPRRRSRSADHRLDGAAMCAIVGAPVDAPRPSRGHSVRARRSATVSTATQSMVA